MINWIKKQFNRFWKWLTVGAIVLAATGVVIKVQPPAPTMIFGIDSRLEDISQRDTFTKDFQHPTDPTKRIKIQTEAPLHYFDGEFKDILDLPFPEGKEVFSEQPRHFMMDLPEWGREELSDGGKVLRIYDKKDVSIYIFKDPFATGKGKNPYDTIVDDLGVSKKKIREVEVDYGTFEVENHKLYVKLPDTLKNPYALQVYDDTDTGSTNNKDSKIRDGTSADTNFGADATVQLGYWSAEKLRMIFDWTLSSGSGTISDIALNIWHNGGTAPVYGDLHELTQTFTEAGVTWNKYDGTNLWGTAGGDYSATIVDTSYYVTSPDGYTAIWLVGASSTNPIAGLTWGNTVDLILIAQNEGGAAAYISFAMKETAGTGNDPYIEITYTPTVAALIAPMLIEF